MSKKKKKRQLKLGELIKLSSLRENVRKKSKCFQCKRCLVNLYPVL